jgi:hypothetical protein
MIGQSRMDERLADLTHIRILVIIKKNKKTKTKLKKHSKYIDLIRLLIRLYILT